MRKGIVIFLAITTIVFFFGAYFSLIEMRVPLSGAATSQSLYVPSNDVNEGPETLFVFIGSSSCPSSNSPELEKAVTELKYALDISYQDSTRSFVTAGISLDWDVDTGYEFLHAFGQFDEISTGRSWLNAGSFKYIFQELPGPTATPQIVIVDRDVRVQGIPKITNEEIAGRIVGSRSILDWHESVTSD